MKIRYLIPVVAIIALHLGGLSVVSAQTAPVPQRIIPYALDSGRIANGAELFFEETVAVAEATWLRLVLNQTHLAAGSELIITSLKDGARQDLNAQTLAQWGHSSAYFNGNAVSVRLVTGGGTGSNRVVVDSVIVGLDAPPESQCGPTNDRVSSNEPERARLMNVGCTASIAGTNSCFITAGHCLSSPSLVNVVEFNVPPSLPSGSVQHPGPEDQYSITSEREWTNGGVGNDWGVFKVSPNTQTGLLPYEAQGSLVTPTADVPAVGDTIEIVGYGVDTGVDNQTQQVHSGPVSSVGSTSLRYRADTQGGNSGSSVTYDDTLDVVAIHTHGGCTSSPTSSNAGTLSTHPDFLAAYDDLCGGGSGGIPCDDIRRLRGFCLRSGLLVVTRMTDSSHDGEKIGVEVNGTQHDLTINGNRAFHFDFGFSGIAVIELTDPAGCVAPVAVDCR